MKKTFKHILTAVAAIALSIPAFAQEQDWSAIKTNKTATYDAANDKVDITLETFVNGYKSNIWTPATDAVEVPLDIVLVLDVSGSMDDKIDASGTGMQYIKTSDNISSVYDNYQSKNYYIKTSNGFVKINSMTTWAIFRRHYVINGSTDVTNSNSIYEYRYISPDTVVKITKLEALQNACAAFIDIVAENSENGLHQIAIVKFAGDERTQNGNDKSWGTNYTQIVRTLTDSDSISSLQNAIYGLSTGGATSADYGLNRAEKALESARTDSKKLIVFFTDGEPNHGNGFDNDVANNAISKAKAMKDNDVTIYTVGVFGNLTGNTKNNVDTYMNNVSSNFPSATSMTTSGPRAKDKEGNDISKYYMEAENAAELSGVFETIAGEEAHDTGIGSKGAGVNLGGDDKSVTLKDIVTTSFVIPQTNGVPTDITLTLIPVDSVTIKSGATRDRETHAPAYSDYDIKWVEDPSKFETITPAEGQVTVDGNTLNIDGKIFDFSENWVGVEEKWTMGKTTPDAVSTRRGKKLVIKFSVKPDPTKEGGKVTTNTDDSGVYVGEDKVSEENKAEYEVPKPVVVPANITIRKSGMNPGESAIFEITAKGTGYTKTYTVAMTANEAGEMKDAVIMKVPIVTNPNAEAEGEELDFIEYTVKETSWSWAYTSDRGSITRKMTTDPQTHIFEFVNTPKADTPKHGEGNANNVFAK